MIAIRIQGSPEDPELDEELLLGKPVPPVVATPVCELPVVGVDVSAGGGVGAVGAATESTWEEATLFTVGAVTVSDCAVAAVAILLESCDWMVVVSVDAALAVEAFVDVDGMVAVNAMVAARRVLATEVTLQPVSQA